MAGVALTHRLSHTTLSHTTLSHTVFVTHHLSHKTLSHTMSCHTIFHTPLCHTPSFTHHLCHTPSFTHHLSHTVFHTPFFTPLCHTPSFTHHFVGHHLSQTIFHTQLCHTPSFTHHLCHTPLCHPPSLTYNLFYFSILHHLLRLSCLARPATTSVAHYWKKLTCGVLRSPVSSTPWHKPSPEWAPKAGHPGLVVGISVVRKGICTNMHYSYLLMWYTQEFKPFPI